MVATVATRRTTPGPVVSLTSRFHAYQCMRPTRTLRITPKNMGWCTPASRVDVETTLPQVPGPVLDEVAEVDDHEQRTCPQRQRAVGSVEAPFGAGVDLAARDPVELADDVQRRA